MSGAAGTSGTVAVVDDQVKTHPASDVVVVGAGLMGVATAYFLNKAGVKVTVVDRLEGPAALGSASHANAGTLCLSGAMPHAGPWVFTQQSWRLDHGVHVAKWDWNMINFGLKFLRASFSEAHEKGTLALYGMATHSKGLTLAANRELGFNMTPLYGTMRLFLHEPQIDDYLLRLKRLRKLTGTRQQLLIGEEIEDISQPGMFPYEKGIAGAVYSPDDVAMDSQEFCAKLADTCAQRGVRFSYNTSVTGLKRDKQGNLEAVETNRGFFPASKCVLSVGAGVRTLLKHCGIDFDLPVVSGVGHSVTYPRSLIHKAVDKPLPTIEPLPPTPDDRHLPIAEPDLMTPEAERLSKRGLMPIIFNGLYNVPIGEGFKQMRSTYGMLLNAKNAEPNTLRDQVKPAMLLKNMYPWVKGAQLVTDMKWWSGMRAMTPDSLPVIGPVPGSKDVFLNVGQGTLGWTLAMASGQMCSELMQGKETTIKDPSPFSADRF